MTVAISIVKLSENKDVRNCTREQVIAKIEGITVGKQTSVSVFRSTTELDHASKATFEAFTKLNPAKVSTIHNH